jgi:hypothetical protein
LESAEETQSTYEGGAVKAPGFFERVVSLSSFVMESPTLRGKKLSKVGVGVMLFRASDDAQSRASALSMVACDKGSGTSPTPNPESETVNPKCAGRVFYEASRGISRAVFVAERDIQPELARPHGQLSLFSAKKSKIINIKSWALFRLFVSSDIPH